MFAELSLKDSDWEAPYIGKKTSRKDLRKKKGCYLIRLKETRKLIYIGMSGSCLYKALYRHFQVWEDQRRVTYEDRTSVEIMTVETETKREAVYLEMLLIQMFDPRDNRKKYSREELDGARRMITKMESPVTQPKEEDLPF